MTTGHTGAFFTGEQGIDYDSLISNTTSTFTYNNFGGEITVESFNFKETSDGNFIEVVKREKPNPNFYVGTWPTQERKDRIFKEIYGITRGEDGKKTLKLLQTIEGKLTPGHYVEESIDFDE